MAKRKYIAYGSNLNVQQMCWRCPDARIMGTGELKDWRLLFKGSKSGAYLTIERCEGYSVPVTVWEVSASDEIALDHYEGFPTFYYKQELPIAYKGINTGATHITTAFVYIMHEDRPIAIPSKHYVDICAAGYKTFGFDYSFLKEALRYSKEVTKE